MNFPIYPLANFGYAQEIVYVATARGGSSFDIHIKQRLIKFFYFTVDKQELLMV